MCPIETPEGPNIGLIGALATFARVNQFGFIETPYRKVVNGRVTDEILWLPADEEEEYIVAQANTPIGPRRHLLRRPRAGAALAPGRVVVRPDAAARAGRVPGRHHGDLRGARRRRSSSWTSRPKQIVSVATALIPFLEHDDANRALMGANMQRQAVPLLRAEAPYIGTGIESRAARDAADMILADEDGVVVEVDGHVIVVDYKKAGKRTYRLHKFERSNQDTCINQRPRVAAGQKVKAGDVLAEGPSTDNGELALGKNLLVAFMPWEGYNFEDAIILNERLVRDDVLTSIHIQEHEVDARDTKLGPEEITRDIPNLSRGDPGRPRRARDHPRRRRGGPRRRPGGQGHPQGRDRAHPGGAPAARHLRREGP